MTLPDFDKAFSDYLFRWMEENRDRYPYVDDMERDVPHVYAHFLDTPADFLGGQKPGEYFEQFDDAAMLVDWAREYLDAGIDLPDMLLNRLSDLQDPAPLYACLGAEERDEMRMAAVTLLREMGDTRVLINEGEQVRLTRVLPVNETAAFLWKQAEGKEFTEEWLAERLVAAYEIDPETALADVRELVRDWRARNLLAE